MMELLFAKPLLARGEHVGVKLLHQLVIKVRLPHPLFLGYALTLVINIGSTSGKGIEQFGELRGSSSLCIREFKCCPLLCQVARALNILKPVVSAPFYVSHVLQILPLKPTVGFGEYPALPEAAARHVLFGAPSLFSESLAKIATRDVEVLHGVLPGELVGRTHLPQVVLLLLYKKGVCGAV